MALAELGIAELRVVRVALHRLVLPEHARDLGRLEVVLRRRVAVTHARLRTDAERLPELPGNVEGVSFVGVVDDVDARAAVGVQLVGARSAIVWPPVRQR